MKKNILSAFVALCLFCLANVSFAQTLKIGYTNADAILAALPEAKTIETDLKAYQAQLETQMKSMSDDFEKKFKEYQAKVDAFAPAVREAKEKELQTSRQNIQEFEQKAQQDLQKKNQALLQPVYAKIQKAIDEVAKAENYTHVFSSDVSGFPILLYAAEEYDLTNKIILKLGGTVPPKTAPATNGGK